MPDVRCASEEEHVSHPAPCLSKRVPCLRTLAPAPPSQGSAHCIPLERLGNATLGPKSPALLRPGLPRPRPPGSDSATPLRSSPAFPGASRHHLHSRRCSSVVPEHRGSRNAQLRSSSPPGRATVATSSCEHHQCPVPRLSRHSVRPKLTPQVRRRLGRVKDAGLRPRASLVLDAVRARRRRGSIYEGKRSFPSVCDEGRVRGHATFRSAPVPAWRRSAGVCH